MKKITLSILLCGLFAITLSAQNVHIPDAYFKYALLSHSPAIDTNGDGEIQLTEATAYTGEIGVSGKYITDLTGIEAFVNITKLYCYSNQLTALNVSNNTALTELGCSSNQLTALDLSSNTALTKLYCRGNALTALDLSNNTALTRLDCYDNALTALDLSNNTALTRLDCYENDLTALDLSNNTALTELYCYENDLTALDLSNNTALTRLDCSRNQLTALNVSNNTALTRLGCYRNQLTALDLSNNTALTVLSCEQNQLTALNVSNNTALTELYCSGNDLTALDLSNNTALTRLYCNDNHLTILDVSNTNITFLNCERNNLTTINLANGKNNIFIEINTRLNASLQCIQHDPGTTPVNIDKDNWVILSEETCTECSHIPDINFRTALVNHTPTIDTNGDGFIQCDEAATYTGTLNVSDKEITDLTGIETFTQITELVCNNNQLTSLDVSNNTALTRLDCRYNALQNLNVANGNNAQITLMNASNNPLGCILHDAGVNPNTLSGWSKDAIATWADDCIGVTPPCIVNIPDDNFKAALINHSPTIDTNGDGFIQCSEAAAYTGVINVAFKQITDLTGIEAFTQITGLYCNSNQLTTLNISANTTLTDLRCYNNQLTTLDVSANTALTELNCNNNQLTTLNVSANTVLTELNCNNNQLTTLDVLANTALTELNCNNNQLTTLNISTNTALTNLYCSNNQLTTLNVSNNTALTRLNCRYNALQNLNVANGNNTQITLMNASNNPLGCILHDTGVNPTTLSGWSKGAAATWADDCTGVTPPCIVNIPDDNFKAALINHSPTIDTNGDGFIQCDEAATYTGTLNVSDKEITDLTGIETFTQLAELNCANNQLTALNVSANTALTSLSCSQNQLTALNVSANTALIELNCIDNQITTLNVSANTALTVLSCDQNQLTALNVSNNTALTALSCAQNQLTTLDVSANTALARLFCGQNQLTTLDVSNNTALTALSCNQNQLTALNVSNNTALTVLSCAQNQLTTLDVSANTALARLFCGGNQLTTLDVSASPYLNHLDIRNNNLLTHLNVSGTNLTYLNCSENEVLTHLNASETPIVNIYGIYRFTHLNLSGATSISNLHLSDNRLVSLDVSGATSLTSLTCDNAQLTHLNVSGATALTELFCDQNQLTTLDVSSNTALTRLDCSNNQLTTLDVSSNTALTRLDCSNNQLTTLDVSSNTALTRLDCSSNQLTTFVSNNTVETLYLGNNQFTTLDLSNNANLNRLRCTDNQHLTSLNVANGNNSSLFLDANRNPNLICIQHDAGFAPNSRWKKSHNAVYSSDCSSVSPLACTVNIPDLEFAQTLLEHGTTITGEGIGVIDTNGNGIIECNEAATYTGTIKIVGKWIENLTGIEAFVNITKLNYNLNTSPPSTATRLDVSANTNLKYLDCSSSILTSLDISANTNLEYLDCSSTALTSLDISANTNLEYLDCSKNRRLTYLDVSNNTALTRLICSENRLTTLDVSNNAVLEYLDCNSNGLTTLDASNNAVLEYLDCNSNRLTTLDMSANTALEFLNCNRNQLITLDVSNNTALTVLGCSSNQLTTLDLSNNTALTRLYCSHNYSLTNLDLSNNTALTILDCRENISFTNLDVSNNTALTHLYCSGMWGRGELTQLDVSNNTALIRLDCANHKLTNLDVSANTNLIYLNCQNNSLTHLNVANNNIGLANGNMYAKDNNITCIQYSNIANFNPYTARFWVKDNEADYSIDCVNPPSCIVVGINDVKFLEALLEHGTSITGANIGVIDTNNDGEIQCEEAATYTGTINVANKGITDLGGIEAFTQVTELICNNNKIQSLDLSANTALININCSNNYNNGERLSSLMLPATATLKTLYCSYNELTNINLAHNTALTELHCQSNKLTSLNVTNNTALTELYCASNALTNLNLASNGALEKLYCYKNQLNSLNISAATNLQLLYCYGNKLSTINVANNPNLTLLSCYNNQLVTLNITNGNNADMTEVVAHANPSLTCIQHDTGFDPTTASRWYKDTTASWSDDCNYAATPQFAITPTTKDFGNTQTGQTATDTFTISNTGTADLVISNFALTGTNAGEFSHNGTAQTIAPNGTYDVTVTFAPISVGGKTASLVITDNAGNHSVVVTGTGVAAATPQFAITPTTKDFGNTQTGQTATDTFTISNTGTADLVISSFALTGTNAGEFSHNGTAQTIAPNGTYDVTVTFAPISAGGKTASLVITDNAGNHSVAVTGTGVAAATPQFAITPTTKDFGNTQTGQTATETFTISNTGTADLVISNFALTGTNAGEFSHNGTAQTIAPNGTYDVTITFAPISAGGKTASLVITDNAGNHSVAIIGTGVAAATPQFAITPTTKDFGNTQTGQTATDTFTISNTGTADLVISSFALTGANAGEFSHNGTAQTIAPNGTYDVTVTFAPTSVGGKTASLVITDNAGNHSVAVTGTGVAAATPQFAITPTTKDFGNTQTGQTATDTFTISNTGTADLVISSFALTGTNAGEFSHNGTTQTIAPNGTYELTVTFSPTSAGGKTASLVITDNAGNHSVVVNGNATPIPVPQFAITPTTKDFGNVQNGQTATDTFTITNTGTADLVISNFALTGTNAGEFSHNGTAQTIAPNGTYEFTVTFAPISVGEKTASLVITDNTGNHSVVVNGNATPIPIPQFAITPTTKDFGNVQNGQTATDTFTITNTGTADLVISSFALTGTNAGEFSHNGTAQTLAPNGTYEFTVTFAPTSVGGKTASLVITDNAGNHSVAVNGTAMVSVPTPQFAITPSNKDFGSVLVGETQTRHFVISNTGTANLNISSLHIDTPQFSHTAVANTVILPNTSYRFSIDFNPTSLGTKDGTLTISSNAGHYRVSLTGNGVAPKFAVTPSSKDFGEVNLGQTVSQTIVISNSGTSGLVIHSLRLTGVNAEDFSHTATYGRLINPNDTYEFTVSFTPMSTGNKTAHIKIADNVGNHSIALQGYGVSTAVMPQFTIAPDAKDFGNIQVGQTATETFTITNTGTADLELSNFVIVGVNASEFSHNGTAQTIAPDGTYEFTVTVAPTSVGGKTASISITDNAGNHSVALTGTGVDAAVPQFAITPTTKDFGDVENGQAITETFTITNTGTADLDISSFAITGANAAEFSHNATAQTISPNGTYEFTVTFAPTSVGGKTASISISDNLQNHSVALTGTAIPIAVPELSVSSEQQDFGDVEVDQTTIQKVTIKNTGTADLIINNVSITGANATEFSHNVTDVITVLPNESYELVITYVPVKSGSKTAKVSIATNGGTHTVMLQGKAVKKTQELQWAIAEVIQAGCDGEHTIVLEAMSTSGLPVTYEVSDTHIATVEGNIVTIHSWGTTVIKAIQSGNESYEPSATLTRVLEVRSNDLVQQHWENTLFFDNSSAKYVKWQWYKNGDAIEGATKAYYADENGLSGVYYVKATDTNGKQITTCAMELTSGNYKGGIRMYPNPVYAGERFTIEANYSQVALEGARLVIASVSGVIVSKTENVLSRNQITAPTTSGVYIVSLQLKNGKRVSANLLVK